MMQMKNNGMARLTVLLAVIAASLLATGCSTAPKQKDQAKVIADSRSAARWFVYNVRGLAAQLDNSAGYVSYPGIGRYGLLIGGGKFGRGVVYDSNHRQIGWAYINMASAGLQVGVQGYKMLVVFRDEATMRRFQENHLTGNVNATIVAIGAGESGAASFTNGVAIYEGDQAGLMAGVSVGLDYMRYEAVGR
ncbi:MAG: YSC84-related protein [Phycisphaerales bacterium]